MSTIYVAEYRNRKRSTRWKPCPWYAHGFVGNNAKEVLLAIDLYGAIEHMEYRVVAYKSVRP